MKTQITVPRRLSGSNPLGRVVALYEHWSPVEAEKGLINGWQHIFTSEFGTRAESPDETIRRLLLVREELARAEASLSDLPPQFEEDVIRALLSDLRQVTELTQLAAATVHAARFPDSALAQLRTASRFLPDDGPVINAVELNDLSEALAALVQRFSEAEEPIRSFVLGQVAAMDQAIKDYAIIGSRSLANAAATVLEEWTTTAPQVTEIEGGHEALKEVESAWKRIFRHTKETLVIGKLVVDLLSGGFDLSERALPPPPTVDADVLETLDAEPIPESSESMGHRTDGSSLPREAP